MEQLTHFEQESENDHTKKALDILRKPIDKETLEKEFQYIFSAARQTFEPTSRKFSGVAGLHMPDEDLLAQKLPDIEVLKQKVIKGVRLIRDPKQIKGMDTFGRMKISEIPDGIYQNINIFETEPEHNDRTHFFDEKQRTNWQYVVRQITDEGMAVSPMFNNDGHLIAMKIYFQGHRYDLHVRTITLDEILKYLENGIKVTMVDYSQVR